MKYLLFISLALTLSLSSCIYRMDIEQGNAIDKDNDNVSKLEIGMSKKQVKFLLGKPAIQDIYHENKWHYLYSLTSNNAEKKEISTMVLEFEGNTLIDIKGKL